MIAAIDSRLFVVDTIVAFAVKYSAPPAVIKKFRGSSLAMKVAMFDDFLFFSLFSFVFALVPRTLGFFICHGGVYGICISFFIILEGLSLAWARQTN